MTEKEAIRAIETIKSNMPTIGYYMIREALDMAIPALEEIQQYRTIGTVNECRAAVYKTIPQKPTVAKDKYSNVYACPCCGYILIHKDETGYFCGQKYRFCPECGERLKWED